MALTAKHHYQVAKALTHLLENRFRILGFKFGLDPLLGLVPWLGDAIAAALAFYIVIIAKQVGVEQKHINRMISHIILDFLIGLVPILGTIADFTYKASSKNIKILEEYGKFDAIEGEILAKAK